MKKPTREFLFIIAAFSALSIWSNHAHLFYAITHRVWWYLSFYASTYVLSVVVISLLAFIMNKMGKKKIAKRAAKTSVPTVNAASSDATAA